MYIDFPELKMKAKSQLRGNRGKIFLIFLICVLIQLLLFALLLLLENITYLPFNLFLYLAIWPVKGLISKVFYTLATTGKLDYGDSSINSKLFYKTVAIVILSEFVCFMSSIFLLIPFIGFIIYFLIICYVSLLMLPIFYTIIDQPDTTVFGAFKRSKDLLRGNLGNFLYFELSFIGWWFLCAITFGIAYIWVLPYYYTSEAHFYLKLNNFIVK